MCVYKDIPLLPFFLVLTKLKLYCCRSSIKSPDNYTEVLLCFNYVKILNI